ncbi:GIY-YIG nuclease family protein [Enterococcus dispar]|uniref:GIY-YIG domain-containing protein n=1 Tax=Enterococcus dispar ATCC 51266 TaxID=1139219 RepID=S1NAK7_9ENTE|nr:GIY-YIG nuclease family protein [Enterococcus dispar]EOT38251.1 hypothetical protein OMK_02519 [Enterococcus dispar ATCC 51266]EOW86062.1 hypothetical protein I569_01385 [Enterococcus dispar ATCC 51266]
MIIYMFKNKINGKTYIGQTIRTFEERTSEHLRHTETCFDKALNKYGIENFEYCIIDEALSLDELNAKETYWIAKTNSMIPNGYNLCLGGNNTCGYTHREESKRKMSLTKRKNGSMKAEKNHYYGKHHTLEIREKMKKAWTPERKSKLSEQSKRLDRSYQFVRVRNKETGEIYNSVKEAGEKTGVLATHITRVCKGKRKSAGGIKWEYVDSNNKTIPSQA